MLSNNKKIHYTFLSRNEDIEWFIYRIDIYLKYLEFKKIVNFVDNTSILVIGKVMVEETSYAVEGT